MKRITFVLVFLCTTVLAFGQPTNQEIMRIISANRGVNLIENGVFNPDLIFPGQILKYQFQDGTQMNIEVEAGDTQWSIVQRILSIEKVHGQVVKKSEDSDADIVQPKKSEDRDNNGIPWDDSTMPWWVWLLALCGLLAIVLFYYHLRKSVKKSRGWSSDPITSGTPQVKGGVGDNGAHSRVRQIAQARYPSAMIEVKNVRRGRLSGPALVHYAEGKPQEKILNNIFAYAGEIEANGRRETVYFLQGCGNDARRGNFMTGQNLVFTPDSEIKEDGSNTPLPAVPGAAAPKPEDKVDTPPLPENKGSEFYQNTSKALEIASEFMKGNGEKHRVVLKVNRDEVEITIDNKFQQKQTQEKKTGQ